jgi:hypothetical protein
MNALNLFICETKKIQFNEKNNLQISKAISQIEKLRVQLMNDTKVMESLSFQTKTPYVQLSMTRKLLPPVSNKLNQLEEFAIAPPLSEELVVTVPSFEGGVVTGASVVEDANADAASKLDTSLPPM